MNLSRAYIGMTRWAVVYPTGHLNADGSIEVEFVDHHFFNTYDRAADHRDSLDRSRYTDLMVVQVNGFSSLTVK